MPDYNDMDSLIRHAGVLFNVVGLDRIVLAKELAKAYTTGFQHGLYKGEEIGRLLPDTMKPLAHCMFHDLDG
jgi:hypothetical protein